MIHIPPQITGAIAPLTAGLIISLINKYILNNSKFDNCCCETVEEEEVDSENDDTIDITKTEMSDNLSGTSAITTAALPNHPVHVYHYVVQHFQNLYLLKLIMNKCN